MSPLLHTRRSGMPHGRRLTGIALACALLLVVLPRAGTAQASPPHVSTRPVVKKHAKSGHARTHAKRAHAKTHAKRTHAAKRAHRAKRAVGQPPHSYAIPPGSFFSYPNRSPKERSAISDRVLYTIQSVWGGRRNSLGVPAAGNGTIRIATWSFDDWDVAKALVAARDRGVSVQVLAAAGANKASRSWRYLRKHLGAKLYRPGYPATRGMYSFARRCKGSCRGYGGTPHSKYFLFDNVGSRHVHDVVVQTSMNLTTFARDNQWNQAQALWSRPLYRDFLHVFRQAALGQLGLYHVYSSGAVVNYFFPRPGAVAKVDPVMQILDQVKCTGATAGGTRAGRTKIRIIQYAIYGQRGIWIAKKLRYLWNHGCNVGIIYSVSSRPVLTILRSGAGRGAIPMRQSVIKDPWGAIVKYNHSKWMTVTGHWGSSRAAWITFSGSANWANLAFSDDEQMQRISSAQVARSHLAAYAKTWKQRSSKPPVFSRLPAWGRMLMPLAPADAPAEAPTFGHGVYRYMSQD